MNSCELTSLLAEYENDLRSLWEHVNKEYSRGQVLTKFYGERLDLCELLQVTLAIDDLLRSLIPFRQLHPAYNEIISGASTNEPIYSETTREERTALEAYMHAMTMLEHSLALDSCESNGCVSSKWPVLICLYNLD